MRGDGVGVSAGEQVPTETRGDGMVLRVTERTRLRRMPERVSLERRDLEEILDAGFVCHLGVLDGDAPLVLPTVYGRDGDRLYVHGSVASRSLRTARAERPVCVTVTLVDGIVVARSVVCASSCLVGRRA